MRYFILTLLLSFTFSECDELTEMQCASNADCEWIENIETDWCSSNNQSECLEQDVCYWYPGGFYLGAFCSGGSYEVDNSYCQENPNPPTCSEMSQIQCNSNSECEWIDNPIETGSCSELSLSVCDLPEYGSCYSYCTNWGYYYNCTGGTICTGGSYEIDNSYCQENPDFIQGDLNGDLILNILDVIIIVDIILNQESSDLADINGDGGVNVLDVIELVDIIINR